MICLPLPLPLSRVRRGSDVTLVDLRPAVCSCLVAEAGTRSILLLLSKVRLALPVRVSERVASSDLKEEDEVAGTCYMVPLTNPGLVHPEPELLGRGLGTSPNSFSCSSQVANTINCGGGSFHGSGDMFTSTGELGG